MRLKSGRILSSIAFRTITPIVTIAVLSWVGLYLFVLRSVSDFANERIEETLAGTGHDVYLICDRNFNDLLVIGALGREEIVRIKKVAALGMIEDFMKQPGLRGAVTSRGNVLLLTDDTGRDLISDATQSTESRPVASFSHQRHAYYAIRVSFEPWEWEILLIKDAAAYASLIQNVRIAYGVTGAILLTATLLFIYTLRKNIRNPLNSIIGPIRQGIMPDYRGITEFEYLSSSIRTAMELHERENRMLNNIYYLAAVKRGKAFFDEVAMAIFRLFDLHSAISKLNPDGASERVVSMYINGEIRRDFDIALRGTPCEGVIEKKHISIIDSGLRSQFPEVTAFAETDAKLFIGFAIFDSRSNPTGIISGFGRRREFTESDIKVLQTIGQIVASEFERLDEEKEKERIREQLYQAHKMEAIGTLAGGIAHDFNNMLQGILGHASLLKAQVDRQAPYFESVDTIEHIAERAAQLTKQLLGFARKGKYIIEPILVNDIVGTVLKIISKTFDRKISIMTSLGNGQMFIEGDRSQIEQVIMNLCLNARDAMPDGGTLGIETAFTGQSDGIGQTGSIVIKVSDTGIGMSDDVQEHIFEPFFTTKELGKGTGMGLAMVYGVVKNHNGSISVRSAPGRGTVFTVSFPAVQSAADTGMTAAPGLSRGKGVILVVDDEEYIRDILRTMLEKLGYTVLLASNGREAVDIYAAQKDEIALVILDLIMPVMGGKETFQRLMEINRNVKVLIASGHTTADQSGLSLANDLHEFLQKPFKMQEISEKVKTMLEG